MLCYAATRCHHNCQGGLDLFCPLFQEDRFLLCTHPSKTLHLWRTGRSDGEPLPMKNDIGPSALGLSIPSPNVSNAREPTMNESNIPHQGLESKEVGLQHLLVY